MNQNILFNKNEKSSNKSTQKPIKLIIFILGFLSALGPFSIDMYLPGFPAIAKDFNTDISRVGLSLTSYFVGISIGQIIYGPLLDRFGRKKPLITGLIIYILAALACAFSPNLKTLIGMRLFSALGGCVGMVAGRAIVRDLFPVNEIARVFSILLLIMGVAPIIAPTAGGLIVSALGWRYIFGFLSIISSIMLLMVILYLPETKENDQDISLKINKIFQSYLKVFKNPVFINYTLAGSIAMSGIFAYISNVPFVYMNLFKMSEKSFAFFFGMNAMGFILGSQVNRFLLNKIEAKKIIRTFNITQSAGIILLLIILLSGFNAFYPTIIIIFCYLFCLGFLNPNISAFALAPFKKNAGSAAALSGSIQMMFSAMSSGTISLIQNGTAIPMISLMDASSILAISITLI